MRSFFARFLVVGAGLGVASGCGGDDTRARSAKGSDAGATPSLSRVIADYGEAWNVTDAVAQLALLEKSFAAAGAYSDPGPSDVASSRDGLVTVIAQFQRLFPGATIDIASGIDAANGHFRYGWKVVQSSGTASITGEDEGEVGSDGLITRITGFFDTASTATTPASVQSLLRALNDTDAGARSTDLASAVSSTVSWTDRWLHADGRAALLDHLNTWISPGAGTTFTLVGSVDLYLNFFRANLTMTQSGQMQPAQLFGHVGADGLVDWASFFDGNLPPLAANDGG